MIQVRLKREKFAAIQSSSMRAAGSGPKTVFSHAGKPIAAGTGTKPPPS
jgi:NosR/NirI family nitrous oxide reductase transcriptional regulator